MSTYEQIKEHSEVFNASFEDLNAVIVPGHDYGQWNGYALQRRFGSDFVSGGICYEISVWKGEAVGYGNPIRVLQQPYVNTVCYCPGDCTCNNPFRYTICGCKAHEEA